MNIAVTTWGNRVSPVFDSAGTLLIADIRDKAVQQRSYTAFKPGNIDALAALLHEMKAATLICGAISTQPANAIVAHHIHLISFVSGNAMDILTAFARRQTIDQTHMMPGCSLAYARL